MDPQHCEELSGGVIIVETTVWRWKSQKIKIYWLGYGFFCGNHKDLAKVSRFLLRESIGWYGFSYGFLVVAYCTNHSLPPPPAVLYMLCERKTGMILPTVLSSCIH
jgi:hypothetical protein